MKILIAPNSFKGSLTAFEAAEAIEKGVKRVFKKVETIKVPLADGGDGTMEVMIRSTGGKIKTIKVTGPLNTLVTAKYGVSGDRKTYFLEMAEASGLKLVPKEKRNPMLTTSKGVGELINIALKKKVKKIVIGIGGSATNDGGVGMAKALGFKLLNKDGKPICEGGSGLLELERIEENGVFKRFENVEVVVACDVNNLLYGKFGASSVFGPQKGALPRMVKVLDKALTKYARIIKRDLGIDVSRLKGGGAAGGIGAGLFAFTGAKLQKGIEIIINITEFEKKLKNCSLVITGEGQIDSQSIFGKVPVGVAQIAKKHGIPVLCIAGSIGDINNDLYKTGISSVVTLVNGPVTLEKAIENASPLLTAATERTFRGIKNIKLH
ncbi:MAG: glycerate kinase [Candidatus Firestonebacteria bacterium]|nr:glycerate kinase [Candidatus Firestonebacteria bacterium]